MPILTFLKNTQKTPHLSLTLQTTLGKVLPIKKRLKKKVVKSPRMKFCQGLIEMLHQKKNKEFNWPFLKAVEWRTLKWWGM